VAEGDTIHRHARRLQAALTGKPIERALAPNPKSPLRLQTRRLEALEGRSLARAEARGKHLLLRFAATGSATGRERPSDLTLHSHLGISGSWRLGVADTRWGRPLETAWAVLSTADAVAVQFGGPRLALLTNAELSADPRLRSLGPDVLAPGFTVARGLAALRGADQGRQLGDVLLDQRVVAGIGNVYKVEGCFAARVSPWRRLDELRDEGLERVVFQTAALMRAGLEARRRPRDVYRRAGRPCPRCGEPVRSRGQGDANRMTYWCPGCQG
jgi:endonuclease VIII